jgi:hypothetical protein
LNTCKPHTEIHPYHSTAGSNLIELLENPRWDLPTREQHILAIPYYSLYYESENLNKLIGIVERPVDFSKVMTLDKEWFIKAPSYPPEGYCITKCELHFKEDNVTNKGNITREIHVESNGIKVKVHGQANPDSDYMAFGEATWLVQNPTIFRAKYSVWWDNTDNCIKFDRFHMAVNPLGSFGWKVESNGMVINFFNSKEAAERLFDFINDNQLNTHCFTYFERHTSSDNPWPPYMGNTHYQYFLRDGLAPNITTNKHIFYDESGEIYSCTGEILNPRIEGNDTTNEWYVTDDGDLDYNIKIHGHDYAIKTLDALNKYHFNRFCDMGGFMKGHFEYPPDPPDTNPS